jgi:hypothetical protein
MKLVNRSYLTVRPKQAFWDWANPLQEDVSFAEGDDVESNIYLVEEDFYDLIPVLEKNYKKIFSNELSAITEDINLWPEKVSFELFLEWFSVDYGSMVMDLEKSDLKADFID